MGGFMISFLSLPPTTLSSRKRLHFYFIFVYLFLNYTFITVEASFLFHIRLSFSQLYIYNSRKTHDMLFFYIFAETFSELVLD